MTARKVGGTLKKLRKSLGLTQAQVAEKAGISSNYYSMIERDQKDNLSSNTMKGIAKALKLDTSEIFNI